MTSSSTDRYLGVPIRILVTGSRDWEDVQTIRRALLWAITTYAPNRRVVLIHGDCPTGADAIAHVEWVHLSRSNDLHLLAPERFTVTPEDWHRIGRRAGPERNQLMVDQGADICLAFPLPSSRGTKDCMKKATIAGIPVKVWEPG